MQWRRTVLKQLYHSLPVLALAVSPCALGDCPVTLPSAAPVEVPGGTWDGSFAWFGSEALAVMLPVDGRWKGMGPSRNFFDKFWVWRRGYEATSEPRPALTFAGEKMDGGEPPQRMQIEGATNAFGTGWSSMIAGMEFPSAGCWRVTAKYVYAGITHDLTFILDVISE
jgi:hypothetical protein